MGRKLLVSAFLLAMGLLLAGADCVLPNGPGPAPAPQYEVAAWVPWSNQASVRASLDREMATIDVAHPFWYSLASDDTLSARSYVDPGLVAKLQAAGKKVVPTLTDGFVSGRARAVLSDPTRRARHLARVVDLVLSKGYDGIDLDYENMNLATRDLFSTFVEDLAKELHAKGKIVSLAVYPKYDDQGSWAGPQSHDYARLGAAADRVNVMGYGYGYAGGKPNPIGPVFWCEKWLAYAVTRVPKKKLFFGIPFYGRDWPDGQSGKALTHADVEKLLANYGPTISYDPKNGESTFEYRDASGVHHRVWFQSPEGTKDKMKLVTKYDIGGTVIWRLGSEDPRLWDSIREVLKP